MDNENDNNNVSEQNVTDNEQNFIAAAAEQNGEAKAHEEQKAEPAQPVKENQNTSPKTAPATTTNRSGNNSSDNVVRARLATIRENTKTGWKRLLTVTQWGGGKFKLDVRDWNPDMTRATKGMTFTRSEAMKLRDILAIIDLSIIDDYQQNDERSKNGDTMLKAS